MRRVGLLLSMALLACEGCTGKVVPPEPAQPPPLPPGVSPSPGQPLLSVDTTTPEVAGVLHGAPPGWSLIGTLADDVGRRAIGLRRPGGVDAVAAADWNLLAVGAVGAGDGVLVCWNRLTGAEGPGGVLPYPAHGLVLVCRHRSAGGVLTAEVETGDGAPVWVIDVLPAGEAFTVHYYLNHHGWLVGPPADGDGIFARTWTGAGFSAPTLIEAGGTP